MPNVSYDGRRQLAHDDFGPMTKAFAIAQLRKSEEWLAKQQGHKSRSQDDMIVVQNIALGCLDLLGLCRANLRTWLSRRDRFRNLRQVKQCFKIRTGHRALRDLIRLTISSLEVAPWLEDEPIVSVHLPRWTKPRVVTAEQRAKIASANRRRAQNVRNEIEAMKQAREDAVKAGTECGRGSQQVDFQPPIFSGSNAG